MKHNFKPGDIIEYAEAPLGNYYVMEVTAVHEDGTVDAITKAQQGYGRDTVNAQYYNMSVDSYILTTNPYFLDLKKIDYKKNLELLNEALDKLEKVL